jgi:hypothetical protein
MRADSGYLSTKRREEKGIENGGKRSIRITNSNNDKRQATSSDEQGPTRNEYEWIRRDDGNTMHASTVGRRLNYQCNDRFPRNAVVGHHSCLFHTHISYSYSYIIIIMTDTDKLLLLLLLFRSSAHQESARP